MQDSPPPRPVPARRVAGVFVLLLLATLAGAAWWSRGSVRAPAPDVDGRIPALSDPYRDSPYENVRPTVKYVGDSVCARCHSEIADAYRTHPMGRSLAPVGIADDGRPVSGLPVEAQGFRYTVEERAGRVFHKETRRDAAGKVLAETEAEVRYALGSGTRGVSYLVERDGFLFQSPLSWYSEARRWDLAPGYDSNNAHFERPVTADCLFCHANFVRPVEGMENRFKTPIFQGHAIGCERCHGPGEFHAQRAVPNAEPDVTIVNPADLTPALRESVCQQCHLLGAIRFPRAGRTEYAFRPGLPLHRFVAVFLKNGDGPGEFASVGHVEQMESSRCFLASNGKLGCTSCHDPHRLPKPSERVAFYRDRCLECHGNQRCSLPVTERERRRPRDDCASCHMPRAGIANIPHTAATDHRILRGGSETAGASSRPLALGREPLIDFHARSMTAAERKEAGRDLGIALSMAGWFLRNSPPQARAAGNLAVPLLESAVRAGADDVPAREALGAALGMVGRNEEALHAFEDVLKHGPVRESALRSKARLLSALKRAPAERQAWQALLAVDPWRSDDHLGLANACFRANELPQAIAACRDALRINPAKTDARALLVQCYLRARERAEAEAEFQDLVGFSPGGRQAWEEWFQRQEREIVRESDR